MTDPRSPARHKLGEMLTNLREAAGISQRRIFEELGVPRTTIRNWLAGTTAPDPAREPDFWALVRMLQQAADRSPYSDGEWADALRAAQEEGTAAQGRQDLPTRPYDPDPRLVRERTDERADMNAFLRDDSPGAPSYLCWIADAPVGKTALLTDYIRRQRGTDLDVLSFFVSEAEGTNTRAKFEAEMVRQIGELLDERQDPKGVREWKRLFAEVAERSGARGRKLLLVVDALDDDVAWSGVATHHTPTASDRESPVTRQRSVRGSIAALLPAPPPPGMRVIVSLRRCTHVPDDLSPSHPLRQSRHQRTLTPLAGVPLLRHPPPDVHALGEPVAGLLAVAGGGLRTADLAELTGLPKERLDRLVAGPAGRALISDDPISETYAPAEPHLARTVREALGEAGVQLLTAQLLEWSRRWHARGWPEGTPPFPLRHELRLLTGADERAAYVLDMGRLRRLASVSGPVTALAQLDAFEEEISAAGEDGPDVLAVLVPISAVRALLRGELRDVPAGAPSLLVRLGDVRRALGVARSAPTASEKALHLADAAMELAHAGHSDAETVALEAAEWLTRDRTDQDFPGTYRAPEPYARILTAARTLAQLKGPAAARPLVRAVVRDERAGTEALIEAAGMLDVVPADDVVAELQDRADTLSGGDSRAKAAAVDLWGALGRAMPSIGPHAGDRIQEIGDDLGPTDGLGAVDVLAAAASALARLPARRRSAAHTLMLRARDRMAEAIAALKATEPLPEDVEGHLRRESAGTFARLAQAVDVAGVGVGRDALDDIRRLMNALPEDRRIGVLGDPLLERAEWVVAAAGERREREENAAAAAADEKRRAERRAKDAQAASLNEARTKYTRAGSSKEAPQDRGLDVRHAPAARRAATHRRSAGLPEHVDGQRSEHPHLALLDEAEGQLAAGNLLRSRELLEEALRRSSPLETARPRAADPRSWVTDLCQALGTVGEFDKAIALASNLPDPEERARSLAALSLGCSLGGFGEAGSRYAYEAARLLSTDEGPDSAGVVAQALAHAGDAPAATALAMRGNAAQRRQAMTAAAAGLVRHHPEEAARIAEPSIEALTERLAHLDKGNQFRHLPELAALLLAFPDIRHPDSRLREAMHLAVQRLGDATTSWHGPSMVVVTLLERLGCLSDEDAEVAASATDRWQRSLQPGQAPSAELALLAAVDGDTPDVRRYAEAARTPQDRTTALFAAAAYLAGAHVPLSTDSRAGDRVIRTCLALTRARGDGTPPSQTAARQLLRILLRSDAWTSTIPLLPALAPGALKRLSQYASK